MAIDPSRLYTALLNTGLQQKDNPLYQVIHDLINNLVLVSKQTGSVSGGSSTTILTQVLAGSPGLDGLDGEDSLPVPGPRGIDGISNIPGPMGQMGAIIFPPDAEDGDIFPPMPGIQGIQGASAVAGVIPSSYVEMDTPVTTTSASLEDIAGVTTTITLDETAHIAVWMNCEVDSDGICTLGLAINIDGVDYDEMDIHLNGASDSGTATVSHRTLTPLPAGTYTIKGRFRRVSGGPKIPQVDRSDLLAIALQGAIGPQGLQGIPGYDGLDGEDGVPGIPGISGTVTWNPVAIKSADQDVTNSTALVDATGLAIAMLTGEIWFLQLILIYSGSVATADLRGNFTFPTSSGWFRYIGDNSSTNAVFVSTGTRLASATDFTSNFTVGSDAAQTPRMFFLEMMLRAEGDGNLQFQFAQGSASAGTITRVHSGSILRGQKIK